MDFMKHARTILEPTFSPNATGVKAIDRSSDGLFKSGENGVISIYITGDDKVEFILFKEKVLAYVKSEMGYPAYYPLNPIQLKKPVKAVLMDLDGTTVRSEQFWIWIIELTIASLMGKKSFSFESQDFPHISGHSVSEHLQYCIKKYCPEKKLEEARDNYFKHTHREVRKILEGRGRADAFKPSPGIKAFLSKLKKNNIKIGLVTSGLYEKAWPEILTVFHILNMGDPREFYDTIITAGYPLSKGRVGTLGELSPKPHPWLYAEAARIGLGIDKMEKAHIIGIEDSGAGVCSILIAGLSCIGISGGNIIESGTKELCTYYCSSFEEISQIIL